jgi:C4-dicarboxylate-specific signal transduction histidine kinase
MKTRNQQGFAVMSIMLVLMAATLFLTGAIQANYALKRANRREKQRLRQAIQALESQSPKMNVNNLPMSNTK